MKTFRGQLRAKWQLTPLTITPVTKSRVCLRSLLPRPSLPPVPSVLTPTPPHPPRRDSLGRGREGKKKTLLSILDGGDFFVGVRVEPFQPLHKNEPRSASPSAVSIPSPFPLFLPPNGDCPRRRPFGTGEGGGQRHRQRRPLAHCATDKCILGLRGSEKIEGFIRYLYSRPHSRMQQVKCRRIRFIRCR